MGGGLMKKKKKRLVKNLATPGIRQEYRIIPCLWCYSMVVAYFQANKTHMLGLLCNGWVGCRSSDPSPEPPGQGDRTALHLVWSSPITLRTTAFAIFAMDFCGGYSETHNTCRRIYWMLKVKLSSPLAEGYCRISAKKTTSKHWQENSGWWELRKYLHNQKNNKLAVYLDPSWIPLRMMMTGTFIISWSLGPEWDVEMWNFEICFFGWLILFYMYLWWKSVKNVWPLKMLWYNSVLVMSNWISLNVKSWMSYSSFEDLFLISAYQSVYFILKL